MTQFTHARRSLLLAAVSGLAIAGPSLAHAQAAAPSGQAAESASTVDEVVVTGIRASQQRAVGIKRDAASVVDAISAQDIGKLPDVTISDSLQRIPGVQILRSAGEGSTVNIRGLPQVTTLLNGEAYLGAQSITTIQPNFNDIPSQLFSGADVIKSTTADQLNAGISGTINLRTRRPMDLKDGLTFAGAVEGSYGDKTKKLDPNVNGLISFRNDRFRRPAVGGLFRRAVGELAQRHPGRVWRDAAQRRHGRRHVERRLLADRPGARHAGGRRHRRQRRRRRQ
jgi:iron complex outermembrane receptor protein